MTSFNIQELPLFDSEVTNYTFDSTPVNVYSELLETSAISLSPNKQKIEPSVQRFSMTGTKNNEYYTEEFEYVVCFTDEDEDIKMLLGGGRCMMFRRLIRCDNDRVTCLNSGNGLPHVLEFLARWTIGFKSGNVDCRGSYVVKNNSTSTIYTTFCRQKLEERKIHYCRSRLNNDPNRLRKMLVSIVASKTVELQVNKSTSTKQLTCSSELLESIESGNKVGLCMSV